MYQAIAGSEMLFVVSAGNDGADTDTAPSYPASYALEGITATGGMLDIGAAMTFDLSTLSGEGWDSLSAESGSALEIQRRGWAEDKGSPIWP